MDRNYQANAVDQILPGVALRKESVDRNDTVQIVIVKMHASLSVRRAWIEIHWIISRMGGQSWSLSVRRAWIEMPMRCCTPRTVTSLSVRRAWIEIRPARHRPGRIPVALRKESVDRNGRCDVARPEQ